MNVHAYNADTAWNRGIPCIFFKILIQLYLLCSFLYSLTYCIKEVINGKIFWRFNKKSAGLWGSLGMKQGNPLILFKILIQLYLFCLFLYFWLTVSRRVSKAIFLYITFISVGLWGSYGLKQGNTLKFFNFKSNYIWFYLMDQKCYQRWDIFILNEYAL